MIGPKRLGGCEALLGKNIGGANVSAADVVLATATAPTHCRVRGLIAPKLNFELRLPRKWNHKLHYGGGGGYNGAIPPANEAALRQGYAQVSSDSGHQGSALDASFVAGDPLAAQLFGSLSVPTVTAAAQEIVRVHYRHRAKRAYFEGCSNGGREALMNVQRYPSLFDGVIARAPAYNWVGIMGAFNRTAKALAAPGGAMSAAKVSTLATCVKRISAAARSGGEAAGDMARLYARTRRAWHSSLPHPIPRVSHPNGQLSFHLTSGVTGPGSRALAHSPTRAAGHAAGPCRNACRHLRQPVPRSSLARSGPAPSAGSARRKARGRMRATPVCPGTPGCRGGRL